MADITAIKAGITKYAANRASEQYPTNTEAAKFNLQYVVAYSLVKGVPKLDAFDDAAIKDERVKALARMVSIAIDPEFADAHEDYPTRLVVTLGTAARSKSSSSMPAGHGNIRCRARRWRRSSSTVPRRRSRARPRRKSSPRSRHLASRTAFDDFWPLLRRG